MGIGGSEWIIIGLITIFLLFGSKKLPNIGRNLGKAIKEYNNSKQNLLKEINHIKDNNNLFNNDDNNINMHFSRIMQGPISTEREKLEKMASSLNIEYINIDDEQLRYNILNKMQKGNI